MLQVINKKTTVEKFTVHKKETFHELSHSPIPKN